jgi:hypothetical protein
MRKPAEMDAPARDLAARSLDAMRGFVHPHSPVTGCRLPARPLRKLEKIAGDFFATAPALSASKSVVFAACLVA